VPKHSGHPGEKQSEAERWIGLGNRTNDESLIILPDINLLEKKLGGKDNGWASELADGS